MFGIFFETITQKIRNNGRFILVKNFMIHDSMSFYNKTYLLLKKILEILFFNKKGGQMEAYAILS